MTMMMMMMMMAILTIAQLRTEPTPAPDSVRCMKDTFSAAAQIRSMTTHRRAEQMLD